ncbi:acyltransferase family protein [Clostridium sp.]|uniref:acyltransferase family protein n=1 Tax=Clostridium sp. TaxID=1506 RepID=UPI003F3B6B11
MVTKERNAYFDNLKGFLILAVIIGNSLELANPDSVNIHFFVLFLYVFHMPLFTFVSGYFNKLSKRTTKEKVIDTVKLYLYAQVFYTFFNFLILGRWHISFQLLMPQWTLWYLLSMVFWYIIADYIKDYKKWIIGSILVSLLIGLDSSVGTIGSVSRTLFFLPFFILGMAFEKEHLNIIRKNKVRILACSILTVLILFLLNNSTPIELFFQYAKYTWYFEKPWFPMFMRLFHYISAIVVGSAIMAYMPKKKTIITEIGKYSLIMYLVHSGVSEILISYNILRYTSLITTVISTVIIVVIVVFITLYYVKYKERKVNNSL